jgi:hypothetical protein
MFNFSNLLSALLLSTGLLMAACAADDPDERVVVQCLADGDCPEAHRCLHVADDSDSAGLCGELEGGSGDSSAATPCESDADCGDGKCLFYFDIDQNLEGGICDLPDDIVVPGEPEGGPSSPPEAEPLCVSLCEYDDNPEEIFCATDDDCVDTTCGDEIVTCIF